MESTSSSCNLMTEPVSMLPGDETQPLLPSPLPVATLRERLAQAYVNPRNLCLPSKAAVLILFWSALVGTLYTIVMDFSVAIGIYGHRVKINGHKYHLNVFLNVLVPYACIAIVLLLYPLSGFVADVCCGRYKTVISSLSILVCSMALSTIICVVLMINLDHRKDIPDKLLTFGEYVVILGVILAFLFFIIGNSGFVANYIQLGLDQLHEAPSTYLGIFVHWAIWTSTMSAPAVHAIFATYSCSQSDKLIYVMFSLAPLLFVLFLVAVIFSCWKKDWFYSEPGQHNPYKTVIKVLHFARRHKYPLRRSAFTYYDSQRPTRFDFAKERYGGPFTTEQVEDVKSFLRILVILLALGPIFLLDVPVSYFIFASFTLHTGYGPEFREKNCTTRWLLLESGTLGQLFSTLAFPVYIWIVYSLLRRCIPKIFTRLLLGATLLFIGVLSMLLIDLLGHMLLNLNDPSIPPYYLHGKGSNTSFCMFKIHVTSDHTKALRLHWGFHIIPNLFIGFCPNLILATAFEFISAQSPHSMKGLLVGVLFATKGLFQLSSAILLLPFSIPEMWSQEQFVSNPKAINCDFGYFFITCALALIGLILFAVMAKRYEYRERDDPPFNQAIVEEVFARNVCYNTYQVHSPEEQNDNIQYTSSFPINVGLHQSSYQST